MLYEVITIGNVGTNDEDIETVNMAAASGVRGCVVKTDITDPSNYRATRHFDQWLKARGIIGLAGVDTRALPISAASRTGSSGDIPNRCRPRTTRSTTAAKADVDRIKQKNRITSYNVCYTKLLRDLVHVFGGVRAALSQERCSPQDSQRSLSALFQK